MNKKAYFLWLCTSLLTWANVISIQNPYAKEVPISMPNSAVFMVLKNNSNKPISLLKATSDVSQITELHTHIKKDGMMAMYRIDKITIPPHGETSLKPMSLHIMLINLTRSLKEGENLNVTLEFDNGERLPVNVPIKKMTLPNPSNL